MTQHNEIVLARLIIFILCVPYFCMLCHNYANSCRKIEYIITNPDGISGKIMLSTSADEISTIEYLGTVKEDKISFETRDQFELIVNGKVNENTRVKILVDGEEVHNSFALIGRNVTVEYQQKVFASDKNYWVDRTTTATAVEFEKSVKQFMTELYNMKEKESDSAN